MQLRRLRYFLAVAERLNFHKAAKALGMSQPALTAQVQALEENLGVHLFTREHNTISLTYAGAVFKDEVQDLLRCMQNAVDLARRAEQGTTGRLRVGFISSLVTAHVLSNIISMFASEFSSVDLDLKNISTTEQMSLLEQRVLDVAFLRLPVFASPVLKVIPIYKEPMVLMLPVQHALASLPVLKLQDLAREPFVLYSRARAPGYSDLIMAVIEKAGFSPIIVQETGELYTMVSLVAAAIGVALGPASMRQYNIPGVVFRYLDELPDLEVAVAIRKDDQRLECKRLAAIAAQAGTAMRQLRDSTDGICAN